jgi:acyl dehydratase
MPVWSPPRVGARASMTRTLTRHDIEVFATLSGDHDPLHFDPAFAQSTVAVVYTMLPAPDQT